MQSVKECYLCRKDANALGYLGELTSEGLDKHHVIYGTADRKLSEKTGLWVYLCKRHHNEYHGPFAVHYNRAVREDLCRDAERVYLETHSFDEWMGTFGKNYLDEDEINRIKTKTERSLQMCELVSEGISGLASGEKCKKTKAPEGFIFLEDEEDEQ